MGLRALCLPEQRQPPSAREPVHPVLDRGTHLLVLLADVIVVLGRAGSVSSSTAGWKAVRILVGSGSSGSSAGETPHGAWSAIGNIFSRATLSSWSTLARRRPLASTGIESGPPIVAIGTIGTALRIASLMNPLRPARTASSRLVHGRSESRSPPGQRITSWPSASAAEMLSGAAGSTPMRRKYHPKPGIAISASWAVPWTIRLSPKCRHHWAPIVHASHTNGAPEWIPTSSTGGLGMFSQPSTSIRNQ